MAPKPVGAADIIAQAIKGAKNKGTPCGVSVFLASLQPSDRAAFEQVMSLPVTEAPHTALAEAANMMGNRVTAQMWSHHRLQRCKCW